MHVCARLSQTLSWVLAGEGVAGRAGWSAHGRVGCEAEDTLASLPRGARQGFEREWERGRGRRSQQRGRRQHGRGREGAQAGDERGSGSGGHEIALGQHLRVCPGIRGESVCVRERERE
jgi:hypothetical protein